MKHLAEELVASLNEVSQKEKDDKSIKKDGVIWRTTDSGHTIGIDPKSKKITKGNPKVLAKVPAKDKESGGSGKAAKIKPMPGYSGSDVTSKSDEGYAKALKWAKSKLSTTKFYAKQDAKRAKTLDKAADRERVGKAADQQQKDAEEWEKEVERLKNM